MTNITNLQNTPTSKNVVSEAVSFERDGTEIKGTVYKPAGAEGALPGVIITGAWTTVKEQMPGTYARALAAEGFVALAFDFIGWGESAGAPRYVEDPASKTADIHAAASYMASRDDVEAGNLSGLGVCASSGYMADAVANNANLSKLALVAPWLHDRGLAEAAYGGAEIVATLIGLSEEEEQKAEPAVLTAASATDDTAPMYQAPYYTEEHRGLISEYDNKFSLLTWKPWLTYDAQVSADVLDKPIFMVGSSGMALPAGAEAYEAKTKAPLEKLWFGDDVNQFDFYDRKDIVGAASKAVADFFKGA